MLSTKFRFIWQSGARRKYFFRNQPIRNKNRLQRPCLLMDRDEMSNLYRGPSIDVSYQVSVHLAKGFQRRRLNCEKLTDDRQRTPSDGKNSHCLWQGEQIKQYQFFFISSCQQEDSCHIYHICVCLCVVISNTYCFVCPMLPDSLDCPFLIA